MTDKPLKIGISTYGFLHLPGSVDLLRMIIRGLKQREQNQFYLLVDPVSDASKHRWSNFILDCVGKFVKIPYLLKRIAWKFERVLRKNLTQTKLCYRRDNALQIIQNLLEPELISDMQILILDGMPKGVEKIARQYSIDVVIPTTYALDMPFVSYLYDCQHKHFPQYFQSSQINLRDKYFRNLIAASSSIIVNSQNAKQDLIKFYESNAEHITALPFTPQLWPDALKPRPKLFERYALPERYFLISNQFWVHKSLETAIEALSLLVKRTGGNYHIVFTGKMQDVRFPQYATQLIQKVSKLGLQDHTTFLGYLPKSDQLEIMKGATAVIQTTLFEGGPGGGAIYDAVALGVPCIVSDIPINRELPESERLVLFATQNAEDLSQKMDFFWNHPLPTMKPAELIERDKRSLANYSTSLYAAIEKAIQARLKANRPSSRKISVITVTKNAQAHLSRTIESVIRQTYQNFEYIIIDSCSTDNTPEIIKAYGKKIITLSEPDSGIYDAMNKGIELASGDILYFLNAGDTLYDRRVFHDVVKVIANSKNSAIGMFYGDVQFVKADGQEGRKLVYHPFPFFYYADNCQCHQVCFYRKAVFEEYGGYNTDFKIYGDQEFNARIVVKHEVPSMHIQRFIARYREGGYSEKMLDSSSLNHKEKKKIQKMYFGDTPDWFFERLKQLPLS